MASAWLVGLWLVIGLRLLSGGGAWSLGWGGSLGVAVLLWLPAFGGYASLRSLLFSDSAAEQQDEARQIAWDALNGTPMLVLSLAWSMLLLGGVRLMGSFGSLPRGGFMNFVMSVLALHLLAWGGTALTQWGGSAWRNRDE